MLGNIEKICETTIRSKNSITVGFNMQSPTIAPLRELGVSILAYSKFPEKYKLIRGDNEPHHYDLIFVAEGKLELETSTGDFVLNPGDFAIIPSWNSRRLELIDGDCYTEIYLKVFEEAVQEILKLNEVRVISAPEIKFLEGAINGYIHEKRLDPESSEATHYSALIASYLKRQMLKLKEPRKQEKYNRLEEVRAAVRKNPEFAWDVEKLAEIIHVSPSHLFKLSKDYFGKTPLKLVNLERMKIAEKLLISTNLPLSQIAERVGFSSSYSFSDAFKRYSGQRPGSFRKK